MKLQRLFLLVWFVAIACFLSIYYRHLHADFPNYSPWSDWSKFTDEGWYGDAAVRHYLFGQWFFPGDFNPGIAVPVLPLLEAAVFHFAGAGLSAARAVAVCCFAASLLALYGLVRQHQSALAATLAVTLLVINPMNFAFMRMGILEPPLILFSLLLLLACARARWRRWPPIIASGVFLAAIVFTKTTGIVVLPAAIYLMWRANHREFGKTLRTALIAGGVAALLCSAYMAAVYATHHQADYWYLFASNRQMYDMPQSHWYFIRGAIWDGRWIGALLYLTALAVILSGLLWYRRLLRNPLFGACVLWIGATVAFIAWHSNLQPRYYLSVLPPAVMLVAMLLEDAWRRRKRVVFAVMFVLVTIIGLRDARQTIRWATNPAYTYWDSAHALAGIIRRDPQPNRLLMSISGSEITLMTGLRSICDDFGTDDLDVRIARYNPGWYASWDDIDPGTLESLVRFYKVQRVASWPAMDDPDRRVLILWRFIPLPRR